MTKLIAMLCCMSIGSLNAASDYNRNCIIRGGMSGFDDIVNESPSVSKEKQDDIGDVFVETTDDISWQGINSEEESDLEEDGFDTDISQDKDSITYDTDMTLNKNYDISMDETSAGLQYMVTNKMKHILLNELHYTEEEVRDIEPQIAAVVIEKELKRPTDGMPEAWKRPGNIMRKKSKSLGKVDELFKTLTQNIRNYPLIGVSLIGGYTLYANRALIAKVTGFVLSKSLAPFKFRKSKSKAKESMEPSILKNDQIVSKGTAAIEDTIASPKKKKYSVKIRSTKDYRKNSKPRRKSRSQSTMSFSKARKELMGNVNSLFGKMGRQST